MRTENSMGVNLLFKARRLSEAIPANPWISTSNIYLRDFLCQILAIDALLVLSLLILLIYYRGKVAEA